MCGTWHVIFISPQNDGQTKIVNKSLKHYLTSFAGDRSKEWVEWLTLTEFWINTNYHTVTKLLPLKKCIVSLSQGY